MKKLEKDKVEIRPATFIERPLLIDFFLKLLKEMNRYQHDMLPTLKNAEWVTDNILLPAVSRDEPILFAFYDKKNIGCVFWATQQLPYETRWESAVEYGFFIEKSYRGKGIGTLLRKEAERILTQKGIKRIYTSPYLKNKTALSSNKKFGFTPIAYVDLYKF